MTQPNHPDHPPVEGGYRGIPDKDRLFDDLRQAVDNVIVYWNQNHLAGYHGLVDVERIKLMQIALDAYRRVC